MAVSLLLVTHEGVGPALLRAAQLILGACPLTVETVEAPPGMAVETLTAAVAAALARLDDGDGVLVLTDLYGATPSNVVARLCDGARAQAVAGISLPMLLRVLNYATLGLDELAECAARGGAAGVVRFGREGNDHG